MPLLAMAKKEVFRVGVSCKVRNKKLKVNLLKPERNFYKRLEALEMENKKRNNNLPELCMGSVTQQSPQQW